MGWGLPRLGRHFCQKSEGASKTGSPAFASLRFSSAPRPLPEFKSSTKPGNLRIRGSEPRPSIAPAFGISRERDNTQPPLPPPPSVLNPLRVFQREPAFPQAGESTASSSVLLPLIKLGREKPLSDSSVCFWHPGTNPVLAPPVLRAGRRPVLVLPSGSENGRGRLALSPSGTAGQLGDAGLRSAPPSGAETGWVDSGAAPPPPSLPQVLKARALVQQTLGRSRVDEGLTLSLYSEIDCSGLVRTSSSFSRARRRLGVGVGGGLGYAGEASQDTHTHPEGY